MFYRAADLNRLLRRIFGPKKDEVMVERRELHSEELHNLYALPNITRQIISRRVRWVRHVVCIGDERQLYKVLLGKPEGKRLLRRLGHRWDDGIKMNLRETGWECLEWIHLAQDRNS
jgi:hypothetical protein